MADTTIIRPPSSDIESGEGYYAYLAAVGMSIPNMRNVCVKKASVHHISSITDNTVAVEYAGDIHEDVPVWIHTDYGTRRREATGSEAQFPEEYFERASLLFPFRLGEILCEYAYKDTAYEKRTVTIQNKILIAVYVNPRTGVEDVLGVVHVTESGVNIPEDWDWWGRTGLIEFKHGGSWPTWRQYILVNIIQQVTDIDNPTANGFFSNWELWDALTGELALIPSLDGLSLVEAVADTKAELAYFLNKGVVSKYFNDREFTTPKVWDAPNVLSDTCDGITPGDNTYNDLDGVLTEPSWCWEGSSEELTWTVPPSIFPYYSYEYISKASSQWDELSSAYRDYYYYRLKYDDYAQRDILETIETLSDNYPRWYQGGKYHSYEINGDSFSLSGFPSVSNENSYHQVRGANLNSEITTVNKGYRGYTSECDSEERNYTSVAGTDSFQQTDGLDNAGPNGYRTGYLDHPYYYCVIAGVCSGKTNIFDFAAISMVATTPIVRETFGGDKYSATYDFSNNQDYVNVSGTIEHEFNSVKDGAKLLFDYIGSLVEKYYDCKNGIVSGVNVDGYSTYSYAVDKVEIKIEECIYVPYLLEEALIA